jgi:hypothetical protein
MPVFHTRLTPDLVERYTRSGHWGAETFYQLVPQRAATPPDREAIIDPVGPKNSQAPFLQRVWMCHHSRRSLISPWPYPIFRSRERGGGNKGRVKYGALKVRNLCHDPTRAIPLGAFGAIA